MISLLLVGFVHGCPEIEAIEALLQERGLSQRIEMHAAYVPGRRIRFDVELVSRTTSDRVSRSWTIAPSDCPLVPELVIAVAEQFVRQLPVVAWVSAPIPPPSTPRLSTTKAPAADWSWGAAAGLGQGLDARSSEARLTGWIGLPIGPLEISIGAHASASHHRLGEGAASVINPSLEVGLHHPLHLGELMFAPQILAAGGLYISWGSGFDENRILLLPSASVSSGLLFRTSSGVSVIARIEAPLVRQRLRELDGQGSFSEPAFRAVLLAGFVGF